MKLKPLFNYVVIKPLSPEEKTAAGIIIPDVAQQKTNEGVVVAIGDGYAMDGKQYKLQLEEGDMVLYGNYAGAEIQHEGEKYMMMRETDVYAKIVNKLAPGTWVQLPVDTQIILTKEINNE